MLSVYVIVNVIGQPDQNVAVQGSLDTQFYVYFNVYGQHFLSRSQLKMVTKMFMFVKRGQNSVFTLDFHLIDIS